MPDNNIIELTPFRADLTRALARRSARLLAATDLAGEVALLKPLEAYYIVREIGLDQALPVIRELSREQLETCIDLDCWQRSDFAADSLDEWLQVYAQGGPEALAKGFFTLDYVVQLLFMSQTVTVYDPDLDKVPPEDPASAAPRVITPDGFFTLDLKSDLSLKIHPYTLLDALYKYDSNAAFQLLRTVRVDLPMQIEEEALRFRNGRMQDIGFVSPDEAGILFSRPSAGQPAAHFHQALDVGPTLPAVYAGPLSESSLLLRALSLIGDQECLARLEQEIVWTINSAVIAYGEKTQNVSQVSFITERVRDTISLGLETLLATEEAGVKLDAPVDAAKASGLLMIWPVIDLFRQGFAATLVLQKEVQQAMGEPQFLTWYNLADTQQSDEPVDRMERAFVTALLGRHPLHGGFDLLKVEKVRAFACLDDINKTRVRLKKLVARICRN